MKLASSALESAVYDRATEELIVEFVEGGMYGYSGVPEQVYRSLVSSSSPGRFFNLEIRDRYPCRKLPLKSGYLS